MVAYQATCSCSSLHVFIPQPCGGAIPLCMIGEFDLPMEIVDRKVTKMKMISPSNREVDVGKTLSEREYIGMCRREVRLCPRFSPVHESPGRQCWLRTAIGGSPTYKSLLKLLREYQCIS